MRRLYYFSWRREWPAAAILAVVLSAVYAASMPPGATLEDTGMLAAVCYQFGIPHPPGYPLYSLLCPPFARLADISPLNPAQAAALLSAFCAAAACVFFYEIARRFGAQKEIALAAALSLGLGARFWSQAIIPEVYTLNALLTAATFAAVLRTARFPSRRRWVWLCLLGGLGLANHWPLYVSVAPAFALFLAGERRFWRMPLRTFAIGAAVFAAGLSPYLYLLSRAHLGDTLSLIPPPENFHEWFAYISREIYTAKKVSPVAITDGGHCAASALWSLRLLASEYTFAGALAAVFGAAAFYRTRPRMWFWAVLFGAASAPLLAGYLCADVGEGMLKTVLAAYPLPAMLFVMIWIVAALNRLSAPLNIVAAFALAAAAGAFNWAENDRRDDTFAEEYAAAVLDSLPPDSAFVVSSDWNFPVFYRRHALGERRDVAVGGELTMPPESLGRRMFSGDYIAGAGFHDWGVVQEKLSGDAAEVSPIPPPLIRFYRRLPKWRTAYHRDTRQWSKFAVQGALFAAARALTATGDEFSEDAKAAYAEIVRTPAGRFGRLDARLRAGAASLAEVRETLTLLRSAEHAFLPSWRSQLRHREGIVHLLEGNLSAARAQWRQALTLDPGSPALIDLLHSMAAKNEWREYARLRRLFRAVENPALRETDSACVDAGMCAAESGGNRLK